MQNLPASIEVRTGAVVPRIDVSRLRSPRPRAARSPTAIAQARTKEMSEKSGVLEGIALAAAAWAERWFPDTFSFAVLALALVSLAAVSVGASPSAVAIAFGDGLWTLIPFTMQMVFVVISGHVVARAPATAGLIAAMARLPRTGRGAVAYVALVSMLTSLLSWAMSLIFSGLLARELARRRELVMDYRAAGAGAYLGLGATWSMGISSSAAQLQANPLSIPPELMAISGVIPFTETIFLWQSGVIAAAVVLVAAVIAYCSAPASARAQTAEQLGVEIGAPTVRLPDRRRPGEWLEYSPVLTVVLVTLASGWLVHEFATRSWALVISNLNSYNVAFLFLGLLLHWRPRRFLDCVSEAVKATSGILIQFPIYAGLAAILINAKDPAGHSLGDHLSIMFVRAASADTFPVLMGLYSGLLGLFIPSGGGRWIVEAPFVMHAASELKVHLGWAVQAYNAAGALPNLVNPFWMVPLIGIIGLKARDLVGFTVAQLAILAPLVLFLLWLFGPTLAYHPPVFH
jgi:short-chain fatty acids transporter